MRQLPSWLSAVSGCAVGLLLSACLGAPAMKTVYAEDRLGRSALASVLRDNLHADDEQLEQEISTALDAACPDRDAACLQAFGFDCSPGGDNGVCRYRGEDAMLGSDPQFPVDRVLQFEVSARADTAEPHIEVMRHFRKESPVIIRSNARPPRSQVDYQAINWGLRSNIVGGAESAMNFRPAPGMASLAERNCPDAQTQCLESIGFECGSADPLSCTASRFMSAEPKPGEVRPIVVRVVEFRIRQVRPYAIDVRRESFEISRARLREEYS